MPSQSGGLKWSNRKRNRSYLVPGPIAKYSDTAPGSTVLPAPSWG
jgi:hypothetical protein